MLTLGRELGNKSKAELNLSEEQSP
jgi:hypothetical protein